jgi:membrane protease YdiL (CAAX protease family)
MPVILFALLSLGCGWFGRLIVDGAPSQLPAEGTPGQLIWILSPALLALLMRRLDPHTRMHRPFRLERPALRLALHVAVLAALAVLSVIGIGLLGGALELGPVPQISPAMLAAAGLPILLFAWLEESAWRGYLLPALQARCGPKTTWAVGSVVWFGWHLPYLDALTRYTPEPLATLAPRIALGLMVMQALYTALWRRQASVWPAFALHGTINLVAQSAIASGVTLSASALSWWASPSADGGLVIGVCLLATWVLGRQDRTEALLRKPAQ